MVEGGGVERVDREHRVGGEHGEHPALLADRHPAGPEADRPHRPAEADEGRHPPTDEEWFNESWYFDGVSDDGSLGIYWRLGRVPNQNVALVTASIVGPSQPTIMLVAEAPLPPDWKSPAASAPA